MNTACTDFRDTALAVDLDRARMSEHGRECADCSAWCERIQREVLALRGLMRLEAPFELDGRVVAALEAGGRQQRALNALGVIGRVEPPLELDRAVDADLEAVEPILRPQRAPAVLDRLVSEELAAPAKTRVRRYLGTLERMATPAELDARVASELEVLRSRRPSRPLLRSVTGFTLAAAAVLLIWTAAPTGQRTDTPPVDTTARYDFELQEGSIDELPWVASGLLEGVLGGGLSVRREL